MARVRGPNRDKTYELNKAANGDIKITAITEQLGVAEGTHGWKSKDK
ncbi:phage terminase small subunit-related protein [Solibacillus sp. FSL K6-1523]